MKCIICGEEAEYIYLGNSYCKAHKDEHQARIDVVLKKPNKKKDSV